jgi:hypothetical protein
MNKEFCVWKEIFVAFSSINFLKFILVAIIHTIIGVRNQNQEVRCKIGFSKITNTLIDDPYMYSKI